MISVPTEKGMAKCDKGPSSNSRKDDENLFFVVLPRLFRDQFFSQAQPDKSHTF